MSLAKNAKNALKSLPLCGNCGKRGPLTPLYFAGARRLYLACIECQIQEALRQRAQTIALSMAQGEELERLVAIRDGTVEKLRGELAGTKAMFDTATAMLRKAADLCLKPGRTVSKRALKKAVHITEAKK